MTALLLALALQTGHVVYKDNTVTCKPAGASCKAPTQADLYAYGVKQHVSFSIDTDKGSLTWDPKRWACVATPAGDNESVTVVCTVRRRR